MENELAIVCGEVWSIKNLLTLLIHKTFYKSDLQYQLFFLIHDHLNTLPRGILPIKNILFW